MRTQPLALVETLSTDANGYAISSPLQYGTYYLKDIVRKSR